MDKLLAIGKIPKLTQKEIENQNRSIMSKEIILVLKNFPTKKNPGPDDFTGSIKCSYQTCKGELTLILLKILKIEEDPLSNTVYETSITLIPKLDKDITMKELQGNIP